MNAGAISWYSGSQTTISLAKVVVMKVTEGEVFKSDSV